MKLLLLGATGLVGSHVLDMAIADERIDEVIAPTRRPLPERAGLVAPLVDFDYLPEDAPWWRAEAVICALGTTMRKAGSREAFRRVDHHYPLQAARIARGHGVPTFVLNSAMGADRHSRYFYNRVKGELERDLRQAGFESLTFVRPGLISGEREEFRLAERVAEVALKAAGLVLPRKWRVNPAQHVALAMLEAAVEGRAGERTVESRELA
ncbi:MAG: NAD(P)H-binding protein [Gammaproteobacteria bacterium]|nr:NAD(P)H-binding protein [Gammaproteobacteria bacterium]